MRKTDYIPLCLVAVLGGFIAAQIMKAPPRRSVSVVQAEDTASTVATGEGTAVIAARTAAGRPPADIDGLMRMSAAAPPERNLEDIRRRLRYGERGTYIAEALKQLDSSIYRWEDRIVEPLRIWIQEAPGPNSGVLTQIARASFDEWSRAGIPVRFTFVVNRDDADVSVVWIEKFDTDNRLGHAKVVYDQYRWLKPGAEIQLAMHYPQGQPVRDSQVRTIAIHEVGHLLGLAHSADSSDVMFPRVYAPGLSPSDFATVRLVYSVPAGSIK